MYFSASWMSEHTGPVKTLRLRRDPWTCGFLGIFTDVDDVEWDIQGLFTNDDGRHVWARRLSDAPGYYSTATNACSGGLHQWTPYKVDVVTE